MYVTISDNTLTNPSDLHSQAGQYPQLQYHLKCPLTNDTMITTNLHNVPMDSKSFSLSIGEVPQYVMNKTLV